MNDEIAVIVVFLLHLELLPPMLMVGKWKNRIGKLLVWVQRSKTSSRMFFRYFKNPTSHVLTKAFSMIALLDKYCLIRKSIFATSCGQIANIRPPIAARNTEDVIERRIVWLFFILTLVDSHVAIGMRNVRH